MRTAFALLAGVVVGALVVAAVESVGHVVFPPPVDVAASDPEVLARLMAEAPLGALVFVLAAWLLGVVASMLVAIRLHPSGAVWPGYVAAGVLAVAAAATIALIPHPPWFVGAAVVTYGVAVAAGRAWARRGTPSHRDTPSRRAYR